MSKNPIFVTHVAVNFDGPSGELEKWLENASIELQDHAGAILFTSRVYKNPMTPSALPSPINVLDLGRWSASPQSRVSLVLSNGHTIEEGHFGVCFRDDGNGEPCYLT